MSRNGGDGNWDVFCIHGARLKTLTHALFVLDGVFLFFWQQKKCCVSWKYKKMSLCAESNIKEKIFFHYSKWIHSVESCSQAKHEIIIMCAGIGLAEGCIQVSVLFLVVFFCFFMAQFHFGKYNKGIVGEIASSGGNHTTTPKSTINCQHWRDIKENNFAAQKNKQKKNSITIKVVRINEKIALRRI